MSLTQFLAATTSAALLCCARPAPPPAAEVRLLDGGGFRDLVRSSRGRPLVVNFWATWCQPCRDELTALDALARERGEEVRVVGVSVDDPQKRDQVREFLAERRVTFPQYIRAESDDELFINAVDPAWSGAVPSTYLYDSAGMRAARLVGQQSLESLETALRPLLADSSRLTPGPSARSAR